MIINLITYSMGLAIMMLMLERAESALEVVNLFGLETTELTTVRDAPGPSLTPELPWPCPWGGPQ